MILLLPENLVKLHGDGMKLRYILWLKAYAHTDEVCLVCTQLNLMQLCLFTVSGLDQLPAKNEMVACKFVGDGNYYRAKVLDVVQDTVKVVYVDYGNLDCATKDRLKPLPEFLKKVRFNRMSISCVLSFIVYAHNMGRFF